jgi:hypothetical protein
MQPLRFIQQETSNPPTDAAHFYSGPPSRIFANQGNQESRLRNTARRLLYAGTVPNEVRWKKPVAPPRVPLPAGNSFPEFRLLELAKGFEPLTL